MFKFITLVINDLNLYGNNSIESILLLPDSPDNQEVAGISKN